MRIITGSARGARLRTPKGMDTRPTADRVKESLFNILGGRVVDCRVLDLFSGTGNLGLEALSRGASAAAFIDRSTADLIRENAEHTHLLDRSHILRGDVFVGMSRLAAAGEKFDLVFCDPPYNKGLWERALQVLDTSELLAGQAIVVVEHGVGEDGIPPLSSLVLRRRQAYGRTTQLSIFQKGFEEVQA